MVLANENESPRAALMDMLRASWIGPTLHAMAALGIADHLAHGPRSIGDLAEASDTNPAALARLMRTLAALGFCATESDGAVHLTPRGELLRSDVPNSTLPYVLAIHAPHIGLAWDGLPLAVRTGQPSFPHVHGLTFWDFLRERPEKQARFDGAMSAGVERRAAALIAARDLTGLSTLVDIGGGQGKLLASVLAANPHMQGVLFDRAEALPEAAAILGSFGVADRCELVAGDFFAVVPSGGDAYVLALIIHDGQDEEAIGILRSCHRAMTPGSRIWLIEGVLEPGDAWDSRKLLDMLMLVLFGAQERTADEYRTLLVTAGFADVSFYPTETGYHVIEAARL